MPLPDEFEDFEFVTEAEAEAFCLGVETVSYRFVKIKPPRCERPEQKSFYNEETKKYVVTVHYCWTSECDD